MVYVGDNSYIPNILHKLCIVPGIIGFMKPPVIPFTQEGFAKLEAQLADYTTRREEVLVRLQTAREMGDLSENGAYKAAKFELGGIDRQLRQLKYLLMFGKVQETKQSDAIDFGNTITLKNDSQEITFMLVGTHESNPQEKKLSLQSPFGQAVLGKKIGDTITVAAPAGPVVYKIVMVK